MYNLMISIILILFLFAVYAVVLTRINPLSEFDNAEPKIAFGRLVDELGNPDIVENSAGGFVIWNSFDRFEVGSDSRRLFERVLLRDEKVPHAVPHPHVDFVYGTIKSFVPHEKIAALMNISKTLVYDQAKEEITARCSSLGNVVAIIWLALKEVTEQPHQGLKAAFEAAASMEGWMKMLNEIAKMRKRTM